MTATARRRVMAEGVAAIQEAAELREAVITIRQLVRQFGLSWDDDALYIIEHDLGFPLGETTYNKENN